MNDRTTRTVATILHNATLSAREHEAALDKAASERKLLDAAFLIEEVADQFDEQSDDPLSALGVEIEHGDGMFILTKGIHSFIVEPGDDGTLLINGEVVRSPEPFYTDALYQMVFQRIAVWALDIEDPDIEAGTPRA